jgi:hypothetical protein
LTGQPSSARIPPLDNGGIDVNGKKPESFKDAFVTLVLLAVTVAVLGGLVYGGLIAYALAEAKYDDWKQEQKMQACRANLQADLNEFWGLASDPTVTKCSGLPQKATCLVQSLQDGTYKTMPFVANCSKRHFDQGIRAKSRTAEEEKRWEGEKADFWADFQPAR